MLTVTWLGQPLENFYAAFKRSDGEIFTIDDYIQVRIANKPSQYAQLHCMWEDTRAHILVKLLYPKYSEGHEYEGTEPIKVMNSNDWQELESPQDIIGRVVCITDVEEDDNSNSTAPRIIVSSRRWYNKREGKDLKGPHKDKCTNIRRLKFDQLLMKRSKTIQQLLEEKTEKRSLPLTTPRSTPEKSLNSLLSTAPAPEEKAQEGDTQPIKQEEEEEEEENDKMNKSLEDDVLLDLHDSDNAAENDKRRKRIKRKTSSQLFGEPLLQEADSMDTILQDTQKVIDAPSKSPIKRLKKMEDSQQGENESEPETVALSIKKSPRKNRGPEARIERTKKLLARFPRGVDDLNADSDEHEESDVSEEKEEAPPAEPLYDSEDWLEKAEQGGTPDIHGHKKLMKRSLFEELTSTNERLAKAHALSKPQSSSKVLRQGRISAFFSPLGTPIAPSKEDKEDSSTKTSEPIDTSEKSEEKYTSPFAAILKSSTKGSPKRVVQTKLQFASSPKKELVLEVKKDDDNEILEAPPRPKRSRQVFEDDDFLSTERKKSPKKQKIDDSQEYKNDPDLRDFIAADDEPIEVYSEDLPERRSPHKRNRNRILEESDEEAEEEEESNEEVEPPDMPPLNVAYDLKDAFKIYVQYVATGVLSPKDGKAIARTRDNYFWPAIRKIKDIIWERKNTVVASNAWNAEVKEYIDTHLLYRSNYTSEGGSVCEACNRRNHRATYDVTVGGREYNSDKFWNGDWSLAPWEDDGEYDDVEQRNFQFGKYCHKKTELYHKLQHYQAALAAKIYARVEKLEQKHNLSRDQDAIELLNILLDDAVWMEELYLAFKELVDRVLELVDETKKYT